MVVETGSSEARALYVILDIFQVINGENQKEFGRARDRSENRASPIVADSPAPSLVGQGRRAPKKTNEGEDRNEMGSPVIPR